MVQWAIPRGAVAPLQEHFDCFGMDNVSHAVQCQSQGETTRRSSVPAISFLQCLDDNPEADPKIIVRKFVGMATRHRTGSSHSRHLVHSAWPCTNTIQGQHRVEGPTLAQ